MFNVSKLIVLVMILAPVTVLADCDGEPLYPETVTITAEINAL